MFAENATIEDKTIYLDGATIHNCTLRRCKLVINGLMPFSISHSHFENCSWTFNGPAAQTLQQLKLLNQGGASTIVKSVVDAILKDQEIPNIMH